MRVGERHLERVEREVDVGAVLVAARREIALHQPDGVLCEVAAVFAGAGPVGVRNLRHDLAALLERFEDDADVEMFAEGGLHADFDVVEVDEDRNVGTFLMRQDRSLLWMCAPVRQRSAASPGPTVSRWKPAIMRSGRGAGTLTGAT